MSAVYSSADTSDFVLELQNSNQNLAYGAASDQVMQRVSAEHLLRAYYRSHVVLKLTPRFNLVRNPPSLM